jgi:hypothetical protein
MPVKSVERYHNVVSCALNKVDLFIIIIMEDLVSK